MFELKTISKTGIPKALEKAERYRLLNEPQDAESICRDVLRVEPDNQDAVATLLLALTDQFGRQLRVNVGHAQEVLPRISDEYKRQYYAGLICERWAKAQQEEGAPGYVIYDWLVKGMKAYDEAAKHRPQGNEEAVLRWNACARIIRRNDHIRPRPEDVATEDMLQDDVPVM